MNITYLEESMTITASFQHRNAPTAVPLSHSLHTVTN